MYHVAGTLITISLLYLISFFFYRSGIYSQAFHRKFWNTILAVTFLFTALAGVFLALRINYKWNIPAARDLLAWHVEAGVAMGLTGIFHLLWHLSYFRNIFSRSEDLPHPPRWEKTDPLTVSFNLFMVGFTSTSVQILLIRELMNITGGYELISGVFLGAWLISSAAGAAIAGRSALNDIRKVNLLFAAGPFISVTLLLLLSRLFLQTGEVPTFLTGMVLILILLIPFCLISGFAFVKLIRLAKETNNYIAGKSFSIETAGGIAAGILLTVLTSGLVNTYELLLLVTLLFAAYTVLSFCTRNKREKLVVKIFFTLIISVMVISEPDILFRRLLLPSISVKTTRDTPYGNLTSGEYSGEESLYYNHLLISYQDDAMDREENIHYAMLQVDYPEKVLLISGRLKSHLPEILKYGVRRVVFVERDPILTEQAKSDLVKADAEVVIENTDAFRFISNSREIFDVIIMLLPPPSTLSVNRFYTTEFFENIRERLSPDGVFLCSPGPNDHYFNQESVNLYSSVHNSLGTSFRNVVPVAGNKLFFIASDAEISVSFSRLAQEKRIDNVYVSSAFLSDDLTESKSAEIKELMDPGVRQNLSAYPVACFHFQSYNFSKSINEKIPAILLMAAAFLVPLIAVRRRNMLMYFSAASLAGFEIIVLLALQLTVGNIYQLTGLVIAVLMAGLAIGAGTGIRLLDTAGMKLKAWSLAVYYVFIALLFSTLTNINGAFMPVVFILLTVLPPSIITGHIFRIITIRGTGSKMPGAAYSADLSGSALGFILLSGIAIPALGIRNSIFLLSAFVITGILFGGRDGN